MNPRHPDPYASLRAQAARNAARRADRKLSPRAKRQVEPDGGSYEHLRGAKLTYGRTSQTPLPSPPPPPTQADRAADFAASVEAAAARAAGRAPRDLVAGPRQGVLKATGTDLVAALRRREADRAAVGRRT